MYLLIISVLMVFFTMISQANARENALSRQFNVKQTEEIQRVASEALVTFSKLVTKENYKQMGFESSEEVLMAKLGQPLQDFMVRLDQLKEYQPASDPDKLLSGGNQVVYPLLVTEQVRSSITIGEINGNWKAVSFGSPKFIKLSNTILTKSAEVTGISPSSYFVVRVPALNLVFLGYRIDNKLMLVPLLDAPHFGFKAGVSMEANEVFTTILPAAREHDGLPG